MGQREYIILLHSLLISLKYSFISLTYKEVDTFNLKNYQPISISKIDYQIEAFILPNVLPKVLNKILSTYQTGFIRKILIG